MTSPSKYLRTSGTRVLVVVVLAVDLEVLTSIAASRCGEKYGTNTLQADELTISNMNVDRGIFQVINIPPADSHLLDLENIRFTLRRKENYHYCTRC